MPIGVLEEGTRKPYVSPSHHARALLIRTVKSRFEKALVAACNHNKIELTFAPTFQNYSPQFGPNNNIITWGVKIPTWWYHRHKSNILYTENGLLGQSMGIWVDSLGWFSESSLCKDRHFAEPYTPDDYRRLSELVKRKFKWDLFQGGNPNGPIMYAIQSLSDAPVKYHYPLRRHRQEDATMLTLEFLKKFLPDRQLIIRPHPKFWSQWTQKLETYKKNMRKSWAVDQSPNIYDTLKTCSAVVSVGSTVLTEALALGIPCAALGDGAYTGSSSIMECSHRPELLANILSWVPEKDKVLGYLCAIIRDHQLPFGCSTDFIINNREFQRWVNKLK